MGAATATNRGEQEAEVGRAKEEMMRQDALVEEGAAIAVDAGVLARCEIHGAVWEVAFIHEDAYKLGNAKFSKGALNNHFTSRRELTDAIKEAIDQSGMDGCPYCAEALKD